MQAIQILQALIFVDRLGPLTEPKYIQYIYNPCSIYFSIFVDLNDLTLNVNLTPLLPAARRAARRSAAARPHRRDPKQGNHHFYCEDPLALEEDPWAPTVDSLDSEYL